eukprot:2596172-Pyramimonas_sp.AAC.1
MVKLRRPEEIPMSVPRRPKRPPSSPQEGPQRAPTGLQDAPRAKDRKGLDIDSCRSHRRRRGLPALPAAALAEGLPVVAPCSLHDQHARRRCSRTQSNARTAN